LIEAVREGRRKEFGSFAWRGEVPDPQAEETFLKSKLRHELRSEPRHRVLYEFYRELIRLRTSIGALRNLSKDYCNVLCFDEPPAIVLQRWFDDEETLTVLHFGSTDTKLSLRAQEGSWLKLLDSADTKWLGPGATIPERLSSGGDIEIDVRRKSICLLAHIRR
jgi:maltooligosyltrehalose trehalohydrolase